MNERALLCAGIPDIADTSHASQRAVEFFHCYYTAKSRHDAEGWLQYFHPSRLAYHDATLGLGFDSRSAIEERVNPLGSTSPVWTNPGRRLRPDDRFGRNDVHHISIV
jgi:hypothetical protein